MSPPIPFKYGYNLFTPMLSEALHLKRGVCVVHLHNGKLHCEDGPAVKSEDGTFKVWFKHGFIHRSKAENGTDGPAIEFANGDKEWYIDGNRHRNKAKNGTDGPAVEWMDGTKQWYIDGVLHRSKAENGTDGPAVEFNWFKMWVINGKIHRSKAENGTDGPAIEFSSGVKEWYRNGKLLRIDKLADKKKWYI